MRPYVSADTYICIGLRRYMCSLTLLYVWVNTAICVG